MTQNKNKDKRLRLILIIGGSTSLALGILGIFLPLLPTTPFLLLSAGCYARSSQRFYNWLINSKYLGTYIENYRNKKGLPLSYKIVTLLLLWITICISILLSAGKLITQVILILVAIGITTHILLIKTKK